jgi:hypothetical protein
MIRDMHLPPWLFIVLFMLAVYRVTRFLVMDQWPPLIWVRRKVTRDKPPQKSAISYLLGTGETYGCPWCMSIWVGGLGTLGLSLYVALQLHESWWPWPWWGILWLATSAVCGFLGNADND